MNDTSGQTISVARGTKTRRRAAVACTHCNSRRLKCDVTISGPPCSRCRLLDGTTECVIYQSRRGKHPRGKTNPSATSHLSSLPPVAPAVTQQVTSANPALTQSQQFDHTVSLPHASSTDSLQNEGTLDAQQVSTIEQTGPFSPKTQTDTTYADLLDSDYSSPVQQQYGTTILYIGNPLHNLAYTIYQRGQSGHHHRLHYPVIDNAALRTIPLGNAHEHGIIDLPRKEVQDELIKTYFSCVQPAYPFLDRVQFAQLYVQRNHSIVASSTSLSIMLLQAVFMVAFTHCPSSVLHQAGFQSRGDAKRTYFERAKLLWDSGQEIDRVVNIQVLLLLQFWWGSPTEQRDSTFWLNAAISLAQGCGMHRCTAQSGLAENERRLWKRIWMCLRMRDEQLAAAYGRPLHIAGDDCDLLPLDESDFLEEGVECIDEELFGRSKRLHYLYFLSMSRLGNIAGLISLGHRPQGATGALSKARDGLQEWFQNLEPELRHQGNSNHGFWVKVLHVFYNYLLILVDRQVIAAGTLNESMANYSSGSLRPAKVINHLFDELVEEEEIRCCPSNLIPALFAAMSLDIAMFRSSDRGLAAERIAKFRLRISMIAMKELSAHWPVCGWVFQLFAKIIRDRHLATTGTTIPADPASPPDLTIETLYGNSNPDTDPNLFDGTFDLGDIFSQFVSAIPGGLNRSQCFDGDMAVSEHLQP